MSNENLELNIALQDAHFSFQVKHYIPQGKRPPEYENTSTWCKVSIEIRSDEFSYNEYQAEILDSFEIDWLHEHIGKLLNGELNEIIDTGFMEPDFGVELHPKNENSDIKVILKPTEWVADEYEYILPKYVFERPQIQELYDYLHNLVTTKTGKRITYVKVDLGGSRDYYYRTDDTYMYVGDEVLVPVGDTGKLHGTVTAVEYYDEGDELPYPYEETKEIIDASKHYYEPPAEQDSIPIPENQKKLMLIEERNKKVERDKAWEISRTRKLIICCITYLVIVVYNILLSSKMNIWLTSAIPVIGYFLSTLSLPLFKKAWEKATTLK